MQFVSGMKLATRVKDLLLALEVDLLADTFEVFGGQTRTINQRVGHKEFALAA